MLACSDRTPKPCRAVAELTGLGLAAMDKSVKLVYERRVRPDDKPYAAPCGDRVTGPLKAAYAELARVLGEKAHPSAPAELRRARR
jgi:hypothetical protein